MTPTQRKKFLEALTEHGNVYGARLKMGVSRADALAIREADPDAWESAMADHRDSLYGEMVERAIDGWEEPIVYQGVDTGETTYKRSDRLLEFLVKRGDDKEPDEPPEGASVQIVHIDNGRD